MDAAEISRQMSLKPEFSWTVGMPRMTPKGDPLVGHRKETYWCFTETADSVTAGLERIVERLSAAKPWLAERFWPDGHVEIYLWLYSDEMVDLRLSVAMLQTLDELHVELMFETTPPAKYLGNNAVPSKRDVFLRLAQPESDAAAYTGPLPMPAADAFDFDGGECGKASERIWQAAKLETFAERVEWLLDRVAAHPHGFEEAVRRGGVLELCLRLGGAESHGDILSASVLARFVQHRISLRIYVESAS